MNRQREKLLNALLFFAKNVEYISITKMSKLLFFFESKHFEQTGYPSIGLRYYAFPQGPVPKDLWIQIKDGKIPDDFTGKLQLKPFKVTNAPEKNGHEFIAHSEPDLTVFSPRELRILEQQVTQHKHEKADDISEISHADNGPWDKTKNEFGLNNEMPYSYSGNEDTPFAKEVLDSLVDEYFETLNEFQINPI